jgi:hypothetical protein
MSYQDERDNLVDAQIQHLTNLKQQQRQYERRLNHQMGLVDEQLNSQGQYGGGCVQNLKQTLQNSLPGYMMPSNIGDISEVAWFFFEQMTFDFGTNPTWSPSTNQRQSFQVTQESGFLLMAVSRSYNSYTTAGALAPLQVEFRDRQSSRQFNDNPIPLQMIGTKANPTILPTPMFLLPNAFFDGTITSFAQASGQPTTGTSRHQLSFFGFRMRVEDADQVLSTIFGS